MSKDRADRIVDILTTARSKAIEVETTFKSSIDSEKRKEAALARILALALVDAFDILSE